MCIAKRKRTVALGWNKTYLLELLLRASAAVAALPLYPLLLRLQRLICVRNVSQRSTTSPPTWHASLPSRPLCTHQREVLGSCVSARRSPLAALATPGTEPARSHAEHASPRRTAEHERRWPRPRPHPARPCSQVNSGACALRLQAHRFEREIWTSDSQTLSLRHSETTSVTKHCLYPPLHIPPCTLLPSLLQKQRHVDAPGP